MQAFNIPKFKIVISSIFCNEIVDTPKQTSHSGAGQAASNGWFQLYTVSTKPSLDRGAETKSQQEAGEERTERIVDYISSSIKGLFPNIPSELILKYGNISAPITQLDVEIESISNATASQLSEFENISSDSFTSQGESFKVPLVNVILCNFDGAPSISSSITPFTSILKLCEVSTAHHEMELLFVGFSAAKHPESERLSKKNFEKLKAEVQKLFGNTAKDKCLWLSESGQLEASDSNLHANARQIHTRLLEAAGNAINSRIKTAIEHILELRNEGPKLSHSLKLNEEQASPETFETPDQLTSGVCSPVSSKIGGTQCRKLQVSDMWYQWILDIINKLDLLGLAIFRLGLVSEALLIYEQLLDSPGKPSGPFMRELESQTFGFAGIVAPNDPLLLASDCCFGNCRTHSTEDNALINKDILFLPLNFSHLNLSKRATYFDIFQMVFLRQILILHSVSDIHQICNRVYAFSRKFYSDIVSKIDGLKYIIASHLWMFRVTITIAALGIPGVIPRPSNSPGPRPNTAISSLKIRIVSSTLPKLIQFLGASESIDVWKHKLSTPKLPTDSNASSMEVQAALIRWATQCISSILLNCICDFEEFSKLEEFDVNIHKECHSIPITHGAPSPAQSLPGERNDAISKDPSPDQSSDSGADRNVRNSCEQPSLCSSFASASPGFSLFHLASKHFSLVCELLSSEVWNLDSPENHEVGLFEEIIDVSLLESANYSSNDNPEVYYNLRDIYTSLKSPSRAYRMLCEVVGMAAMDYISSGQLRSAISLPWGIIFESKNLLSWMLRELNGETSTFIEYERSQISDICFCYRFIRIWLDFPTILLPIPLQWTSLSHASQKLLVKLFPKKVNPVSLSYINFNDSYLLQAEIGIRMFLSILNVNGPPGISPESSQKKTHSENQTIEDQLILETYISKCLENSNIANVDSLQWEFPSHPNLWAHLHVSDFSFGGLKDVPSIRMKAHINMGGQADKKEATELFDSSSKSFKGVTLKIVERQILMALLGGGRLIRLPTKALPCCGLLDPLKPVQGYFYVFHEILRPSGRLFLKSPSVLSPLQSPLGSSEHKMKASDDKSSSPNLVERKEQQMESQKTEQQEVGGASSSSEMKSSSRSVSINGYNSWFQKRSSRHERSFSFSNSDLDQVRDGSGSISNSLSSSKKKDASPRQWMWEIVAGFKWGGGSNGASSKGKTKASSFNGSLYSVKTDESFEPNGLEGRGKGTIGSDIREYTVTNPERLQLPSSPLDGSAKAEDNLSPSKVITVPTPGPSNWVVTEASKSSSKRSVALSPKLALSPKSEDSTQCLVTPPNSWVHKLVVPGIPSRCVLLIYLGFSSPIRFGYVWLRVNGVKWIPLENTNSDLSKKNKLLLEPGLNKIELDVFCEADRESTFYFDSIGLSDEASFTLPINFLWVIPLGALPSPHILARVITEFQQYERETEAISGKRHMYSAMISKSSKDEFEYNRDNAWNPLKKWATLYSFGVKHLSEMASTRIQSGDVIQSSNSLESAKNTLIRAYTGEKKAYQISVRLEKEWIQISNVDMEVTLSCPNSEHEPVQVFFEEMMLLRVDGVDLDDGSKPETMQGSVKLPYFSSECVIQAPVLFNISPMERPTQVTLCFDLRSKIKGQKTETSAKHNFVFLVEPQMDLVKIQPVPGLDQHNLPFCYFELTFQTTCRRAFVESIATLFPRELETSQQFGIMAPVGLEPMQMETHKDSDQLCLVREYSLSHPMKIGSDSSPLKLVWIVPKSELHRRFVPQLSISTVGSTTERSRPFVSGPFGIPMETLANLISLKRPIGSTNELMETSLDGLSLDRVEHPSYSKIDSEFSLVVYLDHTYKKEETLSYCLNYFGDGDEELDNRGCWWFIGARNGYVQAKPGSKIKLEFRVVPLVSGVLKLPSINFGCSNSRQYTYPYFTLSGNNRQFYLGKQIVI
ncbi:hypothetical protein OJ253_2670 [Cryptosporidium canis]|uniref:Uncharacterized protein n=1 Tax=Cryptosporidium canis TaxID=195482 RepID=A0A9D5HWJ7_9CRYT|nr:hypothetical protein OJ253_2670 [Cryptosporidium canis]